jgi:hypothetical protein
MSNSDWQKLRKALKDFGCEEKNASGGGSHVKLFFEGRLITSLPGTPGDNRAIPNTLADIRRRLPGFEYRTKQVRKRKNQDEEDE